MDNQNKSLKERITQYLFKYIEDSLTKHGEKLLPSEKVLMNKFECSRETVRSSIKKLVYHGIILPIKGKGYVITNKLTNLHYSFNVDISNITSSVEIIKDKNYFNNIKNNLTYTKKYFYKKDLVAWSLCSVNKEFIYNITKKDIGNGLINFLMKNNYELFKIEKISEVYDFSSNKHVYANYIKNFNIPFQGKVPTVFTRLFNKTNDILEISIVFINSKYYRSEEHIIF